MVMVYVYGRRYNLPDLLELPPAGSKLLGTLIIYPCQRLDGGYCENEPLNYFNHITVR